MKATMPTEIEQEMAKRLYNADLKIAEDTHKRLVGEQRKHQRLVNEAFDRIQEIKSQGLGPYLKSLFGDE